MQNCGILQTVWQQLLAILGGEFHVKTSKVAIGAKYVQQL